MKTIKIDDELHRELLPLTTLGGKKRSLGDVISNAIKPLPVSNFEAIKFDDTEATIILAEYYISEIRNSKNDIQAIFCVEFENDDNNDEDIINCKKITFNFAIENSSNVKQYQLITENFDISICYEKGNFVSFDIFIDDYMKYSFELK